MQKPVTNLNLIIDPYRPILCSKMSLTYFMDFKLKRHFQPLNYKTKIFFFFMKLNICKILILPDNG